MNSRTLSGANKFKQYKLCLLLLLLFKIIILYSFFGVLYDAVIVPIQALLTAKQCVSKCHKLIITS